LRSRPSFTRASYTFLAIARRCAGLDFGPRYWTSISDHFLFHIWRIQSGLQGFYDPAPSCVKSLRIRYTFGGQIHYCEVPDYKPVVLPLGGKWTRHMAMFITDKSSSLGQREVRPSCRARIVECYCFIYISAHCCCPPLCRCSFLAQD
jgi:hypothetical protein